MRRILTLFATLALAAQAQNQPNIDDAKRAIDQRLQKIWKGLGTKGTRTVLFENVVAGRATPGHFPFRATLSIHDQESGYPPNHYYGRTCVGRLEQETYVMSADDFGGWDAQGRMTPDMSTQTCKNNPSDGISAIPLSTLSGSKAPAAGTATSTQPPASQNVPAPSAIGIAPGAYECWANGQARPLLNFTALGNRQYRDAEGHIGAMNIDPATGRVTFRGGNLDGFLPAGFSAVYHAPKGHPTLSFRNSGGSEIQFCEKQ